MAFENKLWKEILEYARWAPSPHNIQPWKVKIIDDKNIEIFYQPDRLLPKTDPTGRFTTVGFGIFVESISVVARSYGFDIDCQYSEVLLDPAKNGPQTFCKISLIKNNTKEILDKELLLTRRTSRLQYDGKPVDQAIVNELVAIANDYESQFVITSDEKTVHWIEYLNKETLFYDMNDENARTEVGHWVRYLTREAKSKKDGLWAYCMGFSPIVMYAFFHARFIFNLPVIKQLVSKYYMWSMHGTRTVGWLSGPFANPQDWFKAGRMLCRLWLTMTANGVYLHPFGSVVTNMKANKMFTEHFDIKQDSRSTMWLIMRLGFSDIPPRSLRIPLEDIIIE